MREAGARLKWLGARGQGQEEALKAIHWLGLGRWWQAEGGPHQRVDETNPQVKPRAEKGATSEGVGAALIDLTTPSTDRMIEKTGPVRRFATLQKKHIKCPLRGGVIAPREHWRSTEWFHRFPQISTI